MKNILIFIICVAVGEVCFSQPSQVKGNFYIASIFHIAGQSGFDDLSIGPNNRLYVSHGSFVNVLNKNTGDSLGIIPNTPGVHGIAIASSLGKGYTSNGSSSRVTIFDLKSNKVLGEIPTGKGPDGILYDPYSKKIIICNEISHDLSVIDPVADQVIATIPLSGSTEGIVSNGKGILYINIKKGRIDVVNIPTYKLENSFPLGVGNRPLGLAYDRKTNRLFSATFSGQLFILNAGNGHIIDRVHIGTSCDGVAVDPSTRYIFTSNGDTTLSVIKELSANRYKLVATVKTVAQANTMTIDPASHSIFLAAPNGGINGEGGIQVLTVKYN